MKFSISQSLGAIYWRRALIEYMMEILPLLGVSITTHVSTPLDDLI